VGAIGAEEGLVDQGLGVFDAEADGEGFGVDVDGAIMEHLEGVAGAVADGEDDVATGDVFAGF
jgi:hypothetical protein